jgi:predicted O-linked N-acetylglucosamine transferase (SPINDLY family)/predicted SAM-dependent methyltransferase
MKPDPETADAIRRGFERHQAGDLEAAEIAYRDGLEQAPERPDGHYLLGSLLGQSGRLDEALEHLEAAARLDPGMAAARSDMGNVFRAQDRLEDAEAAYRGAISIDSEFAAAYRNLGDLLRAQGRADEAIECLGDGASRLAGDVDTHFMLADLLSARGRYQEACRSYGAGLELAPGVAAAHNNLGACLRHLSRDEEAIACFEEALRIDPDFVDAHMNLADLMQSRGSIDLAIDHLRAAADLDSEAVPCRRRLGQLLLSKDRAEEALQRYHEVLVLEPEAARSHYELGNALMSDGRVDEAIERFAQAVRLDGDDPNAHVNLGYALSETKRFEEARQCFSQALALDPKLVEAHNNLGGVLQLQGQLRPAMEAYEHALELAPDQFYVRSNHLTCLNYHDEADPRDVYEQHRTWAEMLSDTLRDSEDARILRAEPERQLRIGYVSADFRFHSVAFFMSALLEQHDRDGFKVFCYANVPEPDGNTERLTALSDHWRDVSTLHDDEMAAMVRRDSIDILVDLSGHTVGNRLSVFARRPAPIQVTYLGYPNTTGLSVMDYRLTDDITDPRGSSEHLHSEELVRLPHGFLSYQPLPTCPDVRERDGSSGVTFASFNELLKITPPIVDAWCEILERTPNSRLLIKGTTLADEGTRGRVIQRFVENGIAEDRLELIGRTPTLESHLELYNRVDVALDTFPYNGTTTTCEALWMGVPVVSLTGYVHAARVGKSILSAVGLDDLATDDIEAYADCAVALAGDVERRREFRRTLRGRMGASTLMDPSRFTRDLETAFRDMWRRACDEGAKSEVRGDNMATTDTAEAEMLRVNIGGQGAKAGWKVLNILPADYVDYLRDCTDLSCFEDGTVDEFYASHVLEHLGYMGELQQTLREVNRALKPGGVFRISVPDLEVLCRLFIDKRYSAESRFDIMRIIFGGQIDAYDFHKVGLTWENLVPMLEEAGFASSRRVSEFDIFEDYSSARVDGQLISLNVEAVKG